MKSFLINSAAIGAFLALCAFIIWLLLHPLMLVLAIIAAPGIILLVFILDAAIHPKPPAAEAPRRPAPPPLASPVTRPPDTLTPLLLGLIVGWWIGHGPDDPST